MKTQFIHIQNIEDVDTSKISVYDLNKRYIDSTGNMYGLRYNRALRKVEVIRILRTTQDRAELIKNRMIETRLMNRRKQKEENSDEPLLNDSDAFFDTEIQEDELPESPASADESPKVMDETSRMIEEATSDDVQPDKLIAQKDQETEEDRKLETIEDEQKEFNPSHFITQMFDKMSLHKDRFKGIISNIQHSKTISPDERELVNAFEDTVRSIELDGFHKMDTALALYREINEYPRPVSYYMTHLDGRSRKLVNNISTDKQKYNFVLFYEMEEMMRQVYKVFYKYTEKFYAILDEIELENTGKTNNQQRQQISDARFTLESNEKEVKDALTGLTVLQQYLMNEQNFIS
jgi:hypothetical protein